MTKEAHVPSGSAGLELLKLHGYVWLTFSLPRKCWLRCRYYITCCKCKLWHWFICTTTSVPRFNTAERFILILDQEISHNVWVYSSFSHLFFFCLTFVIQESLKDVFSLICVIRIVLIFPLILTSHTDDFQFYLHCSIKHEFKHIYHLKLYN